MELNEEQYERIARALDGLPVELTDQERQAMEGITRDERWLGSIQPQAVSHAPVDKALAAMRSELYARRKIVRIIANVAAAASIAAVIVMGIIMMNDISSPVPIIKSEAYISASQLEKLIQPGTRQAEINLLSIELDRFEADVATMDMPRPETTPMDVKLDSFENELDEFTLRNS